MQVNIRAGHIPRQLARATRKLRMKKSEINKLCKPAATDSYRKVISKVRAQTGLTRKQAVSRIVPTTHIRTRRGKGVRRPGKNTPFYFRYFVYGGKAIVHVGQLGTARHVARSAAGKGYPRGPKFKGKTYPGAFVHREYTRRERGTRGRNSNVVRVFRRPPRGVKSLAGQSVNLPERLDDLLRRYSGGPAIIAQSRMRTNIVNAVRRRATLAAAGKKKP